MSLHPNGAHAAEAVRGVTEMLTDEVINMANGSGGDKYEVEARDSLRKALATLRSALAKTSSPGKADLVRKLERVKPAARRVGSAHTPQPHRADIRNSDR